MLSGQPHVSEDVSSRDYKDGWFVRFLQHPPRSRSAALATVGGMIVLFGFVDYGTGTRFLMIFFYIIPIVLGTAWFGVRAGFGAAVSCSLMHSVADYIGYAESYTMVTLWNRLFVLAVYMGAARCVGELLALQRHLEARVQARTRELERALAAQTGMQHKIGAASRYERNAIGRELHDGLCQQLAATNIAAGMLATKLESQGRADGASEARAISAMLTEAIGQTRQIARGLLLAAIKPAELDAELQELCRNAARRQGVACVYARTGPEPDVDETQASHLFFIAQEALRNALKHACATRIDVALRTEAGALELEVTDDGRGFAADDDAGPAGERRPGLGLEIMKHRAELIGAQLEVESTAARRRGVCVRCRLPGTFVHGKEGAA